MLILGIGLIVTATLLTLMALATDEASFLLVGLVCVAIGLPMIVISDNHETKSNHRVALAQLRRDGWNVSWSQLHMKDETVDVDCLTFGLHKLNQHWRVTVERPSAVGGGYRILSPYKAQAVAKEACS